MTMHARSSEPELFDAVAPPPDDGYFLAPYGLFARQKIKAMVGRKLIVSAQTIEESQFQPASLDLRLGKEAYRVRASFLPGRNRTVQDYLESLKPERIALTGE
ncbi:MAG TPA: 2'-deoxycytidine 5'-triphosphate deaminase, partial [Roseiarcus sp.]|nr:2'-deoxycytidine 5'-triphosphate deaminase [Roseiarcus sp.]